MVRMIRLFLLFEGLAFVVAALIHIGVLVSGYEDAAAATAESVIGGVLLVAWGLTWVVEARTRAIGLAAQGFALLGTLVGTYLSLAGVGPSTLPDRVYHVAMVGVLVWGLVVAMRAGSPRHVAAR